MSPFFRRVVVRAAHSPFWKRGSSCPRGACCRNGKFPPFFRRGFVRVAHFPFWKRGSSCPRGTCCRNGKFPPFFRRVVVRFAYSPFWKRESLCSRGKCCQRGKFPPLTRQLKSLPGVERNSTTLLVPQTLKRPRPKDTAKLSRARDEGLSVVPP